MKYLTISNDIKIPVDAVTQTLAIVARKLVINDGGKVSLNMKHFEE